MSIIKNSLITNMIQEIGAKIIPIDDIILPLTLFPEWWLDGSNPSKIILNGPTISQATDLTVNGHNFAQATALNQPTYVIGGENGLNVMEFDEDSDFLGNATYKPDWNNIDFTFTAVVKRNSVQADFAGIITNRTAGGNWFTFGRASTGNLIVEISGGGLLIDTGVAIDSAGLIIVTLKKDGRDMTVYVDGVDKGTGALGATSIGTTTHSLNLGIWFSATQSFGGDIDEGGMFQRALSDGDRALLRNYFINKWGV